MILFGESRRGEVRADLRMAPVEADDEETGTIVVGEVELVEVVGVVAADELAEEELAPVGLDDEFAAGDPDELEELGEFAETDEEASDELLSESGDEARAPPDCS